MRYPGWIRAAAACVLCTLIANGQARAEVVEEIVARVNGEIITKSEVEQEEQSLLADLSHRYSGAEFDAQVKRVHAELLARIIDRKLLVQRASQMYDLTKMEKALLEQFKEQQKVKTDDELERLIAQDGMTLEELKKRLVEMYAPEEVIRFEVTGRLAVSDKEVAAYYDAHPELSTIAAKATVREIVLLSNAENREQRRADAEKIRARVTTPDADFEAVAREVSDAGTKSNGGLLGEVQEGDLAPELERAAFGLPVGEVSPVIELPHGFHVIKVEARSEARRTPLDELKDKIRADLEQKKYVDSLTEYLKKARTESVIVVNEKYKARMAPAQPSPAPGLDPGE